VARQHDEDVGLDHVVGRKYDVTRGIEHDSDTRAFQEIADEIPDPLRNDLVKRRRRGGHEQLPIDDLVAAVLGEEHVVLVGELQRGRHGHARILDLPIDPCLSIVARGATDLNPAYG
jgi:hypothetical protein